VGEYGKRRPAQTAPVRDMAGIDQRNTSATLSLGGEPTDGECFMVQVTNLAGQQRDDDMLRPSPSGQRDAPLANPTTLVKA